MHDQQAILCVALDRAAYNQGQNAQFAPGIDDSGKAFTVIAKGPGGVCYCVDHVMLSGGTTYQGRGWYENVSGCLKTQAHGVVYAVDCRNGVIDPETNGTLQAKPNGGYSLNLNNVVLNPEDIVLRRLTPTECARLQGMPDWYCDDIHYEEVTEEDLVFWREVFETYRLATDPERKPYTDKQIVKWLKDPYSDSAQYKMWGNGMALPCVLYVMEGVVAALKERFPE